MSDKIIDGSDYDLQGQKINRTDVDDINHKFGRAYVKDGRRTKHLLETEQGTEILDNFSAAILDPLTKLFNRREMEKRINELKPDTPVLIAMIDLDNFKNINDSKGHLAGDKALIAVADVITDRLRPGDLAVRYGGEELLLVLPRIQFLDDARKFLEEIREKIEKIQEDKGFEFKVTGSIGGAIGQAKYAERLIDKSDKLLYQSKKAGKNRVTVEELS